MASGMNNDGSDGNMSDEESSPLNTDIYGGSQRTIQETKPWDVFRNPPPKVDSGSMANQRCFEITAKIMKVLAYLITFIIVLGSGVIAKGTLLFMTSQLREEKNITFCNKEHGREKQYQVIQLPIEERIAWMWCLIFAFMVPELGTLIRAMRICFFKSWKRPSFRHFLLVFLAETLHTIGLAILVFVILPDIDVVKGAMLTNCMCFVPAILGLFSKSKKDSRGKRYTKVIVDLIAIAAQATGFVVWPLIEQRERPHLWLIPVALIFISCGWWENYVSSDSPTGLMKSLAAVKESLKLTRYFTYIFISIWKIICFLCTTLVIILFKGENVGDFFVKMPTGFGKHTISVQEMKPLFGITNVPDISEMIPTGDNIDVDAEYNTTTYVLLIQILSAYFCYIFGKFACKIMIQGFSYAFPVNLTIPVSISLLIAACGLRNGDPCFFHGTIPDYLFFQSPPVYFLNDFISHQHAWVWLLWLLSQTWVTLHIWTPKCERLATTEKLFVSPMYDSLLIDQSMGLNRRRDDQAEVKSEELEEIVKDKDKEDDNYDSIYDTAVESPKIKPADKITRIFACATMWHETKDEMVEFLKSILRLDEDQCARRCAQKYLRIVDPDYYEFETHIFFDDAFEISDHSDNDNQVNRFVKDLVCTLDEAASEVHHTRIHMRAPTKYPTPYGGRLVWVLPGKTKMIAHLKDKGLIRHRKRWSQVMYMYYLLGHRLMELPLPINRKDIMAENTFLLTLDGDIDFQPHAVSLLIDLMKKNRNLGAACGRIHPVGSGPMVWYQMFEYAIGHWLQKATEHMIGCVLCSPGCFSLFRGKALMDDNVMAKYTTQSDQARHYVQYDQGEDRWLCTLLLQRGYRVEYSAASDAYTHCPEGFNEFYNQRRRWVPSTMANIMDLLMDSKQTIKINDNISLPYIFYQILLMGGTILGPGTIFLMLVGAFVAAFHIDNWTSFYYNIIPILFFMLVCFTCKSSIQLLVAQILSTGYALVMMAVIVGTALQLREDGIGSPSAIFLITMTSTTFIAACLHPQEFWCVIPGIIYLLSIPSMYLLLILYSIINLNVVSWGTREVQTKKTKKELEEERKEAESLKKKKKQNSLLGFLQGGQGMSDDDEGSIEISFAGLFKCLLCTHQKGGEEKHQLMSIADSLDKLNKRLDAIERVLEPTGRRRTTSASSRHDHRNGSSKDQTEADQNNYTDSDTASTVPREDRDLLTNPYWIEDSGLRNGPVEFLSENEISFWKDMLKKYLYPIDEDPIEKARIAADLIELRNKSVFAFFMFNALFVLVVFLLQLNKDQIHVNWPLGIKTNITYIEETAEVHISKEYLQLEPIGLVFVFFFALILVIQFTAMMFHRFGTLSHILASTDLNWNCTKNSEELTQDALMNKNGVEIARNLQRLDRINGDDDDNDSGSGPDRIGRRKTIQNLEKHAKRTRQIGTLDVAFKKRFYNLKANGANEGTPVLSRKLTMNQETMKALEVRRNSIMAAKRKSQMQTLGAHNEYGTTLNNNGYPGRNHRSSSISSREIFNQGHVNSAYEPTISEEETESRSSLRMVPRNSHVGFR